jgi:DNA excision repair protein ERCC-4
MIIIQDTREQLPLNFRLSKNVEGIVSKKLDTGDYSIEGYEDKIAIERKSAMDLFGTLGKGHKRFKKELERALEMDYFCILVEESFVSVYEKLFDNAHRSKMRGDVIIKICYTLKFKYGIDVIFCNGRKESAMIIRNLFMAYLKQNGTTNTDPK